MKGNQKGLKCELYVKYVGLDPWQSTIIEMGGRFIVPSVITAVAKEKLENLCGISPDIE